MLSAIATRNVHAPSPSAPVMRDVQLLSRCLDRVVRPNVYLFGAARPAFQVCGAYGLCLGAGVSMLLVAHRGLSPWVMGAISLALVLSLLTLTMLTKILTGEERLIYYHHEIAAIAVAALLLRLWRQPVAPYLDIAVLGVGLLLLCGRAGCLMAGCCHGRPHRWGVRYTSRHADAGFTPCYVGVRLLPVQAFETLWVLAVVAIGIILVWTGAHPGLASAWYVAAQGVGRFGIEFLRGDAGRRYFWGFSEAQWTSALLVGAAGVATNYPAVAAMLPLIMIAVTLARRMRRERVDRLLHAGHVQEIAQILWQSARLDAPSNHRVAIGRTSLGIQLSSDVHGVRQYAISRPDSPLDESAARALAGLIARLTGRDSALLPEVTRGSHGVFHVELREAPNAS